MTPVFCTRCGVALPGFPPVTCGACGYAVFVNPKPSGGVVIVEDGRFLALLRAREPKAGLWELPGGFCGAWENPADAAIREAREELGVGVSLDRFLGMFINDYEYQGETLPVLDCFWLARIVDGTITLDPDESAAYRWLPLDDAPTLAFRSMDAAIEAASNRV